jgi:hypothetical protein
VGVAPDVIGRRLIQPFFHTSTGEFVPKKENATCYTCYIPVIPKASSTALGNQKEQHIQS